MTSPDVIRHRPRDFASIKNHPLSGITFPRWLQMLREHASAIEWTTYWRRLLFLTFMSVLNMFGAVMDAILYGRVVANQQLNDEPVFIIGHPRTGTTHLHNLLSRDDRFAFATTFSAGFPSGFLSLRPVAPLLALIMDHTRPMDNMPLRWHTPQEDELAVNQLSGGTSPYMALMFPRHESHFRPYYRLNIEDTDPASIARWKAAFIHFLKKTQFAAGGKHKRLLLKSPVHTARVKLLREMFPKAQFVFCHRNPLEVFQSAANMADKYYWQCYFQRPTAGEVQEFILHQGELLHRAYVEDIAKVEAGRKTEVRFDVLNEHMDIALRKVYDELGWGHAAFEKARPSIEQYRESLVDFKMNQHARMSREAESVVRTRWKAWFDDLGYD